MNQQDERELNFIKKAFVLLLMIGLLISGVRHFVQPMAKSDVVEIVTPAELGIASSRLY